MLNEQPVTPLLVSVQIPGAPPQTYRFTAPFRIGRTDDCDVAVKSDFVSRSHVQVAFENGLWMARDLGSSNGVYANEQRVAEVSAAPNATFRLGIEGPTVSLELERPAPAPAATVEKYVERYFTAASGAPAGEHTMLVRRAFQQVQTKQKRKYANVIAALAAAAIAAAGYAFYIHLQFGKQKALAESIFYAMKSVDLDIAGVEKLVNDTHNAAGMEAVQKYQQRRREMEKSYDQFLSSMRTYDPKMSQEDRLILRIARIFGECELDIPAGFVDEVHVYIKKWQSSGRYKRAVMLARDKGYTPRIAQEFLAQDLPPQFYYLGMQESDFDQFISGPMTHKGIAKGMWQFIPETAVKYGMKIGPLLDLRRPDPGDDRHRWEIETNAASRYIKDLYSTDAQASGLLVIASYNWGEDRVIKLIRSLPMNPRERNFWKLLATYRDKIPQETYDYVYYIFSAAVIGENPKLFGFDFDNPLGQLEQK
jgi:membrane-bound lytic murein transglycosylase D